MMVVDALLCCTSANPQPLRGRVDNAVLRIDCLLQRRNDSSGAARVHTGEREGAIQVAGALLERGGKNLHTCLEGMIAAAPGEVIDELVAGLVGHEGVVLVAVVASRTRTASWL